MNTYLNKKQIKDLGNDTLILMKAHGCNIVVTDDNTLTQYWQDYKVTEEDMIRIRQENKNKKVDLSLLRGLNN